VSEASRPHPGSFQGGFVPPPGYYSQVTGEKTVPVLYLDIDGTVREGKDDALGRFVNGPDDVRVFPEAVEMMRRWKAKGGRIIGVSNQGGIALGIVSHSLVAAAMLETQRQAESLFDKVAWCMHHPNADDPEMARCWCRKPKPGLVIETALDLARETGEIYRPHLALMVGDRPEDEECARLASIDFLPADEWRAHCSGLVSATTRLPPLSDSEIIDGWYDAGPDDSFCTDCQKLLSAHEKCEACGHYDCDCICDFLRDDWPTHPSNPDSRS
jgi:D-glycero-D-manno-heptose 1,7-bisphosphate phosphatase